MADPELVFDRAYRKIIGATVNAAGNQGENQRARIQRWLEGYQSRLYKLMVGNGFIGAQSTPYNLEEMPSFGEYPKLSEDYYYRKLSKGARAPGFYEYRGKLKAHLTTRDPMQDFGKPHVTFDIQGSGVMAGVRKNAGGRWILPSGRFARVDQVFRRLSMTLNIALMAKNQKLTPNKMESMGFPVGATVNEFGKYRGRFGNRPERPLFRPFFEWYRTTNLVETFKEETGLDMR